MQTINDLKQKCQVCGTEYPYRKSKRFCSDHCKQKAYRFKDVKFELPKNSKSSTDILRIDLYEKYVNTYIERFGASKESVLRGDLKVFSMPEFLFITRNHSINEFTESYFNYLLAIQGECDNGGLKISEDYEYKAFFKKIISGGFDISFE